MKDFLETAPFDGLAPAGFYLALRVGFAFPLVERNHLPPAWIEHYTRQGLMVFDPVIQWAYSATGWVRWSGIDRPDPRGVLTQAASFGLRYGVTVSYLDDIEDAQRSFGWFCRSDREQSDDEITALVHHLQELHHASAPPTNITEAEIEALRMVRSGMRTKQIAFELGVSEGAVKQRLRNAKEKLRARTGTEAATRAQSFGLL